MARGRRRDYWERAAIDELKASQHPSMERGGGARMGRGVLAHGSGGGARGTVREQEGEASEQRSALRNEQLQMKRWGGWKWSVG